MAVPPSAGPGPTQVAPRAGLALALLLGINLFNYIDRQVLSAVLPKLELDAALFDPADPWLKFKLGWLTTAFFVSYMLLSPVFGRLGDTRSRWALVGVGVIVWSLASGASGLATGFWMLLFTRCLVGIGEAAYGPVAPAMLSDLYPERQRGRILAWLYMAIPVGSALGFVIGGAVADTAWGWRGAFQVVVLPGLLLGALCFFMREPPRPPAGRPPGEGPEAALRADYAEPGEGPRPTWRATIRELVGIRSFVLCCAGMTCTTFVLGGVAAWAPYYIFEHEARFQVTPEALDRLAALKTTAGDPVIPPAVVYKLRLLESRVGPVILDTRGLKDRLDQSTLTKDERAQYQSRIFEQLVWREYALTPKVLDRLAEPAGPGGEAVPGRVVEKLRSQAGERRMSAAELREKLVAAGLTPDQQATYRGRIFEEAATGGSISLSMVGTVFGGIVVVSGLVATLFGGWLGDKLRDRVRGSYFQVSGWGALVAFPAFVGMLKTPFPYAWGLVFVAVFFLFINTGPANTVLANVTRHRIRATAFAVNILIIHALGDVISPPIIGLIADLSSLGTALLLISALILAGGLLWLAGARSLDEETRRVTEAERHPA
jgi:MFS family permease